VTAIAERSISAVLTATEVDYPALFSLVRGRGKLAPLVGTVAEWLRCAFSAGTPGVGLPCFDFDWTRGFLGDVRGTHDTLKIASFGGTRNLGILASPSTTQRNTEKQKGRPG
jgi:hypothetical protein